jgi:hypothetical protein
MKRNIKQQVIDALKGEFIVTECRKIYMGDDLDIQAKFSFHGKKGEFIYTLIGGEAGITDCSFDEDNDEDIYHEIHEWVSKHIKFSTMVRWDEVELKNGM